MITTVNINVQESHHLFISREVLYLESGVGKILQFHPQVVDTLLFLLYSRTFTVATRRQSIRCLVDVFYVLFIRSDLAHEFVKLLLQQLSQEKQTFLSPLYQYQQQKSGTCCRRRSHHCRHGRHSSAHWRWNCSVDHTAMHTTGNSSIDTSVTRDTQRPWSFARLASWLNSLMMMMMNITLIIIILLPIQCQNMTKIFT